MNTILGQLKVVTYSGPADWASKKRRLENDSAQAGMFDPRITPYFLDAYAAFADPRVEKITIGCGAQMGKTDFLLNLAGYTLDVLPSPIMFIEPTQRLAESISTDRFARMARNAGLHSDSREKVSEKSYNGTKIIFAWASSASQLCSHPVRVILLDELNQMKNNINGQGSPYALAEARTTTYVTRKIVAASTPTIDGLSAINKLYDTATCYKWAVPCDRCKNYLIPCLQILRWTDTVDSAWLECPTCKGRIYKCNNQQGKYILVKSGPPNHVGYWISGLASPFRSLVQAAEQYVSAKMDSQETLKTCINTVFGETYTVERDKLDTQTLLLAKEFPPVDAKITRTCGVDVQDSALYYAIRAWASNGTSWQIAYGQLDGYTDQPQVWDDLEEVLNAYAVRLTCVDGGYQTPSVYAFCDRLPGRVIPCKGRQQQESPVRERDRHTKYGYSPGQSKVFNFDDGYFKRDLFSRIRGGSYKFLPTVGTDYLQQLMAEEQQFVNNKWIWVQLHKDNHYLDAEKLSLISNYVLLQYSGTSSVKRHRQVVDKGLSF